MKRNKETIKRVVELTEDFESLLSPVLLDMFLKLRKAIDDNNRLRNDYYYNLGYLQGKHDYSLEIKKSHPSE